MFSISDLIDLTKIFANPFNKVTFSFKILDPVKKDSNHVKAELLIYNLSNDLRIIKLKEKYLSIDLKESFDRGWGSSEKSIEKRTLRNSWVNIDKYIGEDSFSRIVFDLQSSKVSWIRFEDLKKRRSIKVFFRKINDKWQFKVGRMNLYKDSM